MNDKLKFEDSLFNALRGIGYCLKNEKHMRIHLIFAASAMFLSWYFRLAVREWLPIIFSITLVITLEMVNTAIERTVDLYTGEKHPLAKAAKDVAAGAVLVAALNALVIGAVVFLPKICKYFSNPS